MYLKELGLHTLLYKKKRKIFQFLIDKYLLITYTSYEQVKRLFKNLAMHSLLLDKWSTQLKKGILELCILNTLSQRARYGYDIVRNIRKYKDFLGINEGTVYTILHRFKKDGLVNTRLEESTKGPVRKYYELSHYGREYLFKANKIWDDISSTVKQLINFNDSE